MKKNIGYIIAAVCITGTSILSAKCIKQPDYMIGDGIEKGTISASCESVDEIDYDANKVPETAEIECETVHFECVMGTAPMMVETDAEHTEEDVVRTVYTVNGEAIDDELYEYIRVTLSSMNLSHLMPYVLCQIYQESRFDIYAEALNGQDKGILQFRLRYWDFEDGDIFDPYAQIRVYLGRIKDKTDKGYDIYQIISDHYTGGVEYNSEYVADVLQWMETIEEN